MLALYRYLRFYLNDSIASYQEQAQPLRQIFTTLLTQHPMFESLLTLIAPHTCLMCDKEGFVLCPYCQEGSVDSVPSRCFRCTKQTNGYRVCESCRSAVPLRSVWIAGVYRGDLKQVIHAFKFEGKRAAATDLARILAVLLPTIPEHTLLVPVPTASNRMRERGFDHARLLAREYSQAVHAAYDPLLIRTDQHRQLGRTKKERMKASEGSMRLRAGASIEGASIVLIDDVVTTGSTLSEAARVLRAAGAAHVDALVVAQTIL